MDTLHLTISESSPINDPYIMNEVNKWLVETYQLYYNKSYELYKINEEYSLYLHLNNQDRPYIIGGQFLNDEQFIAYIKKDLRDHQIFLTEYFELYRRGDYIDDCSDKNTEQCK